MKLLTLSLAIVLAVALSSRANAQLLDFDFQFSGGTGDVSGELLGVQNNSFSASPLDIIITSIYSPNNPIPAPFDFQGGSGLFIVNNDVITSGSASADSSNSNSEYQLQLGYQANPSYLNYYDSNRTLTSIYSSASPSVFYTYAGVYTPAAAPEPSTWALLLSGLGLLAFWHKRARHIRC